MNSEATLAAVKVRLRKKRIGSIGAAARSSQRTNSARTAAPASRAETTSTDVQPASLPRTRPHTIASRPAAERARPGRSSRLFEPCVSWSCLSASGISTSPNGTFSQKIHCQEMPCTIAPPTSGPSATARPPIPPQAPSATPRRFGGTAAERIVNVSGSTIAPPSPWIARAAISSFADPASAARAEPPVKIARPIAKSRRRPKRSPSAAPVRSRTAKVRV